MPVSNEDLRVNPLVENLRDDFVALAEVLLDEKEELLDPPELVIFRGFLGEADAPADDVRVYQDPDLGEWLDVPKRYIVRIEHVEKSDSRPWGEDVVWMVRGSLTTVEHSPGDGVRVRDKVYRPARVRGRR